MSDVAKKDEEVCTEGENFTKIFYDAMDRKRDKINYLYTDDRSVLVWNGNCVEGCDNILRFVTSLPETEHELVAVDVQRIPDCSSDSPGIIYVNVGGNVLVGGTTHAFSQTFTLVVEDGKYKIKSDKFRYVD